MTLPSAVTPTHRSQLYDPNKNVGDSTPIDHGKVDRYKENLELEGEAKVVKIPKDSNPDNPVGEHRLDHMLAQNPGPYPGRTNETWDSMRDHVNNMLLPPEHRDRTNQALDEIDSQTGGTIPRRLVVMRPKTSNSETTWSGSISRNIDSGR